MKEIIPVDDKDLGVWFSVDGKAIKNQEQLDLAIIALTGVYGYKPVRPRELAMLQQRVNENDRVDEHLFQALTMMSDACLRYLNRHLPTGYKFDFQGMEYEQFVLRRSKSHRQEEEED